MPLLDGFDFNPLSFGAAPGGAPDAQLAALLLRKGQQMGGLLSPDQPIAQPPNNEPFRMPQGTPSLNSSPLPAVITGAPGEGGGSALGFAPETVAAKGIPLPRPRPDGAPDEEGAALPVTAQPTSGAGGLLSPAAPDMTPAPSFLDRVGQGVNDNSGLLIGLGAGLAGAPSWGTGISRGLTGAAAGAAADASTASANLTYNALIKKGIDPQVAQAAIKNPDLMKTLVAQTFGPQTLTALGSGYVADKNGNVRRAFEPEDKIPAGFAKGDDGNMHFIPGGPADPAYARLLATQGKDPKGNYVLGRDGEIVRNNPDGSVTVVHKNVSDSKDSLIPDETADFAADQILLGAKGIKTGYGRGKQGPENIAKIDSAVARKAKEQGLTAADLVQRGIDLVGDTSRERTAATQEGRMTAAGIEAKGAMQLGLAASKLVPRNNWVPVNKVMQMGQSAWSDPNLKAFGAANLTIINTYARAINPTGNGNVHDKVEAGLHLLNNADGPAAYEAVIHQMEKEVEMAHRAPSQARAGFRQERSERVGGSAPKAGSYVWTLGGGLVPGS